MHWTALTTKSDPARNVKDAKAETWGVSPEHMQGVQVVLEQGMSPLLNVKGRDV